MSDCHLTRICPFRSFLSTSLAPVPISSSHTAWIHSRTCFSMFMSYLADTWKRRNKALVLNTSRSISIFYLLHFDTISYNRPHIRPPSSTLKYTIGFKRAITKRMCWKGKSIFPFLDSLIAWAYESD